MAMTPVHSFLLFLSLMVTMQSGWAIKCYKCENCPEKQTDQTKFIEKTDDNKICVNCVAQFTRDKTVVRGCSPEVCDANAGCCAKDFCNDALLVNQNEENKPKSAGNSLSCRVAFLISIVMPFYSVLI